MKRLMFGIGGLGLSLGMGVAQAQSLDYPSVWECDGYKPNWYCDQQDKSVASPQPLEAPPAKPQASGDRPRRIELKDIRTAEQMRQELKRREDLAVMNPSEENLKDYLVLWQMAQEKGAVFADAWQRVVWQNPDLDYAQRSPVNNAALRIHQDAQSQHEEEQLRMLARDHGLIFFFRSDCPYCHAMAPTVRMLADKYGIEVLGVSLDGRGMEAFPHPADGRTQAAAWGVERVPALFIGSKKTGDRAPIGFGMLSLSEMVSRIFVLTATKPGQNF